MAVRNVTFEIPPDNCLSCIACDSIFKTVTDAIEHTVVCHQKNRLTNKYEGQSQIEKIKGSVTWTRTNVAHLLDILKKKVADLGKAKAHYRTNELGRVNDEITTELANIIGPGITRYQMTRKWTLMQRRTLQYERSRKKLLKEGMPPPDPPPFHPSVKEIMRCVEEEKIKYLKEMEYSDKSYALKIKEGELEIPEELSIARDDHFRFSEPIPENTNQPSQNKEEDGESMVLKRSSVLHIINQLEEGVGYEKIMREFGITEPVLAAIEQNGEIITQGAQRCSLCHILLSTYDDVVAHEIECSRTYQQLKDSSELSMDKEEHFVGFLPETVDQLVDVILKRYPKLTRGIEWDKVAAQLSHMDGVTALRCSQKWHNLISKCRRYQRLNDWAKNHNHDHNIPPPDYYDRLIPYAESRLKVEPSQESIQKFLSTGLFTSKKTDLIPGIDGESTDINLDIYEGKEASLWTDEDSDLSNDLGEEFNSSDILISHLGDIDIDANEGGNMNAEIQEAVNGSPETSVKLSTSEEDTKLGSVYRHQNKRNKCSKRHKCHGKHKELEVSRAQTQRIQKLETKLDDVLGLLDDIVKDNQRLTREAEMREKNKTTHTEIAEKLEKLTQVFVTAHQQNLKHFQTMTKMWERHHQEHQASMRSLISEISHKRKSKICEKKRKKLSPLK
ncbi:uncharacterized protein [Palaemon carinicauda]|uniref:uncharacterized protein isoform X3 n=1 Tax=Palaemon carinicauda TaxID=392227 RepID=UPI0035B57DE3